MAEVEAPAEIQQQPFAPAARSGRRGRTLRLRFLIRRDIHRRNIRRRNRGRHGQTGLKQIPARHILHLASLYANARILSKAAETSFS